MKILLNKKTISEMIEHYYNEKLDTTGKVQITVDKDFGSYGMSDVEECLIKFKLKGKIKLFGKTQETIITISTDEVLEIIKYYIEQEGYNYKSYSIDKGLDEEVIGYGLSEHVEKTPYFNGIEVMVEGINKVKERNKNENK